MRAKVQHEWTREVNHRWRGDGDDCGGGGQGHVRVHRHQAVISGDLHTRHAAPVTRFSGKKNRK